MAKYNVSKREAEKYGVKRVLVGGGKSGGSGSRSSGSSGSSGGGNLSELQEQYMNLATPTQDESNTKKQLDDIIASRELGIQKVEQEPMAQGFITGQTAGIQKAAAIKSMPLEQKLARLQAERMSSRDLLRDRLGFEERAADRAREDERYRAGIEREEERYRTGLSREDAAIARDEARFQQTRAGKLRGGGTSDKSFSQFEKDLSAEKPTAIRRLINEAITNNQDQPDQGWSEAEALAKRYGIDTGWNSEFNKYIRRVLIPGSERTDVFEE